MNHGPLEPIRHATGISNFEARTAVSERDSADEVRPPIGKA